MAQTIKNAKKLNIKAKAHTVTPLFEGETSGYKVQSGTSGNLYSVRISSAGATCSCEWSKYRPGHDRRCACSHVQSVYKYRAENQDRTTSAWASETDAQRQHRPIISLGDGVTLTTRKAEAGATKKSAEQLISELGF